MMDTRHLSRIRIGMIACALVGPVAALPAPSQQATRSVVSGVGVPETEEWGYRVRYGFKSEWWEIFRKYQIAILERQKQLGYVKEFQIWAPELHTSEESRWDYRVIIIRSVHDAPPGQSEEEIAKALFPDQNSFRREENRRWELTTNHWDLPILVVGIDTEQ
jgi:hypothetical protein